MSSMELREGRAEISLNAIEFCEQSEVDDKPVNRDCFTHIQFSYTTILTNIIAQGNCQHYMASRLGKGD